MGEAKTTNQKILSGRAVSRGIGAGKALCLYGNKRQFYRVRVEADRLAKEVRRFQASVRLASRQLKQISNEQNSGVGENQANIFETHLLFLQDKSLLDKIEKTIVEEKVNAEWAVKTVTDTYINRYKTLSDKHLREKHIDLEDITERLLTALGGGTKTEIALEKNTVVVAKEIHPSTLIELSHSDPTAIITENGGWTSHAFILARELGIPAVTGLKGFLRMVETGEELLVDGFLGQVTKHPTAESLKRIAQSDVVGTTVGENRFLASPDPLKTLDGFEVTIRANVDISGGYKEAEDFGAKGIGLYRSEFLFNQNRGFPTEEEQYESYLNVAEKAGEHGVRIRTFDLGVDQLANQNFDAEKNPALGLTAIRLSLRYENEFRSQLRALLRASFQKRLDIVLPMISDISEIRRARVVLEEERKKLSEDGFEIGFPKIGAMIEVPSAVIVVDKIAEEVDFLSLGTNDLVQYILAVDRDNEDVSDWFRTLHPAIIKSISLVIDASRKNETPVIVCGEMAGSPLYAAILVGLGANELSMNLNSIPRVSRVISGIAREEAREVVNELEECATAGEVERKVRENFSTRWKHLFDENSLPAGDFATAP